MTVKHPRPPETFLLPLASTTLRRLTLVIIYWFDIHNIIVFPFLSPAHLPPSLSSVYIQLKREGWLTPSILRTSEVSLPSSLSIPLDRSLGLTGDPCLGVAISLFIVTFLVTSYRCFARYTNRQWWYDDSLALFSMLSFVLLPIGQHIARFRFAVTARADYPFPLL